jgi:hypothetical protein
MRISYDTGQYGVTSDVIDGLACAYAEVHPHKLPTHAYISLSTYREYMSNMFKSQSVVMNNGGACMVCLTSVGVVIVQPMPAKYNDSFTVVVGTDDDLQLYLVDEIFEEVVLKDCERE